MLDLNVDEFTIYLGFCDLIRSYFRLDIWNMDIWKGKEINPYNDMLLLVYMVTVSHAQYSLLWFFGAFVKLRKLTFSIFIAVRLSVRIEKLVSHWTNFTKTWYLGIFRKYVQ